MNKLSQYSIHLLRVPKYPLQTLLFLILLVFSTVKSEAHYFHGLNIDTDNFPMGMTNFSGSDSFGDQRSSIDKNAFIIEEKRKSAELINFQALQITAPKSLSFAHAFGVVHSITPKRIEIANKTQKKIDKLLPLQQFKRTNISFDKHNYLNQDVSYLEIIGGVTIELMGAGGANCISRYVLPCEGALKITSSGEDKIVCPYLPNVLNEGSKGNIIRRASNINFTHYPFTFKAQIPETLTEIEGKTCGKSYEKGNLEKANFIYKERLCTSQYTNFETIIGPINHGCRRKVPVPLSIEQHQASIACPIIAVPEYLFFAPAKDSLKTGALAGENSNFTVEKFLLNKQHRFLLPERDTVSTIPAIFYKNEQSLGLFLQSNGLELNYRFARWASATQKQTWEAGLTYLQHSKEVRSANPYYGSSEKFVFGKKNWVLTLHLGFGQQWEITPKNEPGSIGLRWFYQLGATLAMVKPIYYEVLYVYDSTSLSIREERFSADIHTKESIYGRAPFAKGIDELSVIPGLYGRLGVSLEFSSRKLLYHALEVGVAPFVYAKSLPIMDSAENNWLYLNLFVAYRVGIITSNQKINNRRLRRLRRKLE